ncbi:uncharacterized protein BX663DRAFT_468531 [Cokeromyces recurvatus]|uniref:uncharacterized protein n=1 Tax=Cokeromyces recurvatus TaxID=90255 RepID=UPI00221F92EC|nr:uncharacterized protein BX663DRAFT_468531 [Cokeromyces recurvatus]KAI7905775.1 hypothetical protein BX663DRAFT_468531 [Cokeromyces recurvatus]
MKETIEYFCLQYECHVCFLQFTEMRSLRRHYIDTEGLSYPNCTSKFYNKKYKKYISKAFSKNRNDVKFVKACLSCTTHYETIEELGLHLKMHHEPASHPEFEKSYSKLNNAYKWMLSTGKIVEDALYNFSKKLLVDHPSNSFIIDVDDQTYLKHNIFTEKELEEIKKENVISTTIPIPSKLRDYMNSFNCTTTEKIRQSLVKRQHWETEYNIRKHHDFDWLKFAVHALLREYESGSLSASKKELWYNIHIWSFIDRIFDDVPSLEVVRSEAMSISSANRKNANRVIGSVSPIERKQIGYKCDFLIRDTTSDHEESLEYGADEVGIRYEQKGTKLMTEGSAKLPKVLKDMLDHLILKNKDFIGMKAFGIIHSGLTMQLITADRPHRYITRISRGKELSIPSNVEKFGAKVLPVIIVVAFIIKLIEINHHLLHNKKVIQIKLIYRVSQHNIHSTLSFDNSHCLSIRALKIIIYCIFQQIRENFRKNKRKLLDK